jgi:hypothetical protein
MLDALRQENRDLAGQVGYLQARVQMQEATILALQAPQDAPERPQEVRETAETPDPVPEPRPDPFPEPLPPTATRSAWWRRWLGAVGWPA